MIFFSTCPIDVLLADRGGKGPLEENCLDSDLTCSPLHSVCNTKHIFCFLHLILVFTRSIPSFCRMAMLSLALPTKVKLILPENLGEATKFSAMLYTTQSDSGLLFLFGC